MGGRGSPGGWGWGWHSSGFGANMLTLTATTVASPQNVTIHRMTPVGGPVTIFWGDGSSTVQAVGDTAAEVHAYATAGTYRIKVTPASRIQQIDIHDPLLSRVRSSQLRNSPITYFICHHVGNASPNVVSSVDMSAWTPTNWRLYSMPAGTYTIDSQHMSAWTPANWWLYNMPAGTYTIDSAHMSTWTPTYWYLFSMPAGTYTIDSQHMSAWTPTTFYLYSNHAASLTFTITAAHFAGWTTTTMFFANDNSLLQADVNALLYGMYQAAIVPRTVASGTINVGGTNAAPSGVFQAAAACPVDAATPGKEVAHELLNDGCGVGFNTWATVTFTP